MNLKLGRSHPTKSKLKLAHYLGPALPPPPASCDWTAAMSGEWGVMANDALGDCTCAAMGHAVQVITSNGDGLIIPSDESIVQMYEQSGYDPSDPNTDRGWTELAAMQFMVDHGLAGVRVDAFADVDNTDVEQFKQAIALMGGAYIGVEIDQSDMDDFQAGRPWTSTRVDNIVGGHALWVPTYDADGITVITWGKAQPASWDWFQTKCDEAHAVLMFNWCRNSLNCNPDGFDLATLENDLKSL